MGGPDKFQLQRIVEAAKSPDANLTYSALTGRRKQSVGDVERLFNPNLIDVLDRKGYTYEACYIRVIMNWRKACDEHGLSQSLHKKYNQEFLSFMLDELIPWHSDTLDYSTMEVNRYLC